MLQRPEVVGQEVACLRRMFPIQNCVRVNTRDSKAKIFDVFLCHNSADKEAVRGIAQELSKENIKPWMDEADIIAGSFWHTDIGEQIETAKSAAVFVGANGLGPWQKREIIALNYCANRIRGLQEGMYAERPTFYSGE